MCTPLLGQLMTLEYFILTLRPVPLTNLVLRFPGTLYVYLIQLVPGTNTFFATSSSGPNN